MSNGLVIAAVDGSEHSLEALEWARLAALRHRAGLLVAHVLSDSAQLYAGRRSSLHDASQPQEYADPVGDHVRALLAAAPEQPVEVRYEALEGSVPEALRVIGAEMRPLMLVLGSRGRGSFAALLLGSDSRAVATTAPCPVVVVPPAGRAPGVAGGTVVLGLHTAETHDGVPAFAFAEAAARGTAVQVVSAYPVPPSPAAAAPPVPVFAVITPEELAGNGDDTAPAERDTLRAQQERLAPFRDRYPGVPVEQAAVPGGAAGPLVEASRSAALVVVGRHHPRRRLGPVTMGSVAHAVLQHAHGPVAVVPATHDEPA